MTQHMGLMEFSDDEDVEEEATPIAHLTLLPPFDESLGWITKDVGDGETTLGRIEERDITIAHPSVSGLHAAIGIVDLPEAGGKRVTLKDLRSMNGTYLLNAETGASTRLAPKKATLLPVEGCQIQFGSVVCKVAMGPAPAPSLPEPAAAAAAADHQDDHEHVDIYNVDTQYPGGEIYDVDTQAPGGGDDGGNDQEDTKPLASVAGDGQKPAETTTEPHQGGDDVEASAGETQLEHAESEDVADADEEGNGHVNDDGTVEGGLGSGADDDGGGAGAECGYPYEPPTQVMPLYPEDTDEEQDNVTAREDGRGDQDAVGGVERQGGGEEQGAATENVATAAASYAPFSYDKGPRDVVGEKKEELTAPVNNDGDDKTADEGDTAELFNTQEEEEMGKNSVTAVASSSPSMAVNADTSEGSRMGAPRGLVGSQISVSTEPQYPVGSLVTSPGGASEATTERQESPGLLLHELGASRGQQYSSVAMALDTKENFAGEGTMPKGYADGAEEGKRGGRDGPGSDNDGSTASSEALIPAGQDLAGFETELAEAPRSDNQDNEGVPLAQHQVAAGTPRAPDGLESTGAAVADDGDAAHESDSDTDATVVDTDDGEVPAELCRPADARHGTGSAAPVSDGGPVARPQTSSEGPRREESLSPGTMRSPGGTLRRTTTEDAMKAIAREQQRAEAAGAVAAAARAGANDIADKSDESEDKPQSKMEPPPQLPAAVAASAAAADEDDTESDLEGGMEPDTEPVTFAEPRTEAMEVEPNADGDDRAERTNEQWGHVHGGVSTAESPANALGEKEVVRSDEGIAAMDVDVAADHGGLASAMFATVDNAGVGASTELPTPGKPGVGDGHENNDGDKTVGEDLVEKGKGKQDLGSRTSGEEKKQQRKQSDGVLGERSDASEEQGRDPATPTAPLRSSKRRRTKKKHFGEEVTPPKHVSTPPNSVSEEETTVTSRGGSKRRRSSPSSATTAAGETEAISSRSNPPPPKRNTSKRDRRSSTVATPKASEDEPSSARRKPPTARSRGGVLAGHERKGSSSSQQTESPAVDDQIKSTARCVGKGNGKVRRGGGIDQGGGSAARGGKKRKAGVAAEELQDEEVDRTSMRRKAARTRKVAEGEGERAERTDREQPSLEDDGDDIFQPSVTDRKGGKSGTRKGQQATLRSSKSPVMEAVKEVAATPAASLKGRKGKRKTTAPKRTPSKSPKKVSTIGAAVASASPTRTPGSSRGKGRAVASPMSAARFGRSESIGGVCADAQEGAKDVKVCFTSFAPRKKERECIKKLGISEVENVMKATHLVAGGEGVPLKRTPKLLAGMGRCRYVVDVAWLHESAEKRQVLDGLEYILYDTEAEEKNRFKMRTSLGRRSEKGLLEGLSVHVDPAVAGVKEMRCPPLAEMEMVVESAGGTWLKQIPKGGAKDSSSLLVISHPSALVADGVKGEKSREAVASGRGGRGYLPEMLFLCILRQKMEWPDELAVGGGSD